MDQHGAMDRFSEQTGYDEIHLFFLILAICGTVLNLTCITILLSIKGSLRTQLKLLSSLAVSDCVIDIVYIIKATIGGVETIYIIQDMDRSGPNGMFRFTVSALFVTVQWTSLLTMLSLAVDLLLRVKKPLQYRHLMSKKRGSILIACIWTLCGVFSFGLSEVFAILGNSMVLVGQTVVLKGVIMLSFVAFCILYACILCGVRSITRTSRHGPRSRALQKTAVTSALILVSYLVCLMPEMWMIIFYASDGSNFEDTYMFMLGLEGLFLLNTIIDPIIFVTRVPEVRNRFNTFLQCLQRRPVGKDSKGMDTPKSNAPTCKTLPGESNSTTEL